MDFYELKDEDLEMVIGGLEMPFYRGSDDDAEAGKKSLAAEGMETPEGKALSGFALDPEANRKEFNKLEMTHF